MKKIMLIDDRTARQLRFTKESGINLDDYSDILDNYTADNYNGLLEEFKNDNFSKLDIYDVIITHRYAFGDLNGKVINIFKDICKKNQKSLVFFSGGISNISMSTYPFEHLLLNSKIFYSHNLELFFENLKTNNIKLLILAFGSNWKLNLLLTTLEKINLYVSENHDENEIVYDDFIDETNIELIKEFLTFEQPDIENDFVKMSELKKITHDLTNQIKQQVVLNV